MTSFYNILVIVIAIIAAPFVGGLLTGIDRVVTARMQNRFGPPVMQPFYDFIKLMGKERITVNQTQMVYVIGYLLLTISSLVMLVLKQDLLMLYTYWLFRTYPS
jgi:formate hydrogenlyase subunit 4